MYLLTGLYIETSKFKFTMRKLTVLRRSIGVIKSWLQRHVMEILSLSVFRLEAALLKCIQLVSRWTFVSYEIVTFIPTFKTSAIWFHHYTQCNNWSQCLRRRAHCLLFLPRLHCWKVASNLEDNFVFILYLHCQIRVVHVSLFS